MYDRNSVCSEWWYAAPECGVYGRSQSGGACGPLQSDNPWVYVPNARDIYRIGVQPGQTVWAMSQNEPIFAVRTADRAGLVNTAFYRFEEAAVERADEQWFVTRSELEQLLRRLEEAAAAAPSTDVPEITDD